MVPRVLTKILLLDKIPKNLGGGGAGPLGDYIPAKCTWIK